MEIIYSGAGGRAINWTTKYATNEMKKFIFGSKYLETRKKDYNDIDDYIESIPKINDNFDKKEFDSINEAAIKKIKETKIKELDMDFKIYFLDKVGNYTIQDLGTDRVLDDITGETSRIDFEEEIEMGWADIDNYFNFLSKAEKNGIKEKTERKKEIKVLEFDERNVVSQLPNKGKPKTKTEKLNSLGFDYIYAERVGRKINLLKPIDTSMKFGLERGKLIPSDLMQSYDKFYSRVKLNTKGEVKQGFDLPYVFTRSLYFAEEMKESLENKVSNTKELINNTKELIRDLKSVSSKEDKERQQKKLEDSTKLLKSLNESLERARKYMSLTASLRKEIKDFTDVYNDFDDKYDVIRNKIEADKRLTDEELNFVPTNLIKGKGRDNDFTFKDEYLKLYKTTKESQAAKDAGLTRAEYFLEIFDEATDAYDNEAMTKMKNWLEEYQKKGNELNKEFEEKLGIKSPISNLTAAEQKEAFTNPKAFVKKNNMVKRALNDLKNNYRIYLRVTKEDKRKKKDGKMTMVTTYNVNSFYIMLEEELVPPVVPKGTGGGSQVAPFRAKPRTRKAPQATDDEKPKSRVSYSGKKDYEVKKDINLFAKRINKKLKELELVI